MNGIDDVIQSALKNCRCKGGKSGKGACDPGKSYCPCVKNRYETLIETHLILL